MVSYYKSNFIQLDWNW